MCQRREKHRCDWLRLSKTRPIVYWNTRYEIVTEGNGVLDELTVNLEWPFMQAERRRSQIESHNPPI